MNNFEKLFENKIAEVLGSQDPAHDLAHVKRVVLTAKKLAKIEGAKLEVVVPAAWLHDLVNLPKNHPDRALASQMAARAALDFLKEIAYPVEFFEAIAHAIEAHSFSAQIRPQSLEAKIVQDADRLDALGAIGLARLFSISTQMQRPFYSMLDPFAIERTHDDKEFAIDHIHIKLKQIVQQMNTPVGREEAGVRFHFIEEFLEQLNSEISG